GGPRVTARAASAPARAVASGAAPAAASARGNLDDASAGTVRVRLRGGDTLWGLARRYDTTVAALQRLNHLGDSSLIYAGTDLEVPARSGASEAAPASTAVRTAARVSAPPAGPGSLRQLAAEV